MEYRLREIYFNLTAIRNCSSLKDTWFKTSGMKYILLSLLALSSLMNTGFAYDDDIEQLDLVKIADLRPTTYYTPSESKIDCKGKYGRTTYTGKEREDLKTKDGKYIATVCKRFSAILLMEGAAVLTDRGQGEIGINYAGKVKGQARYGYLDRCKFGQGVQHDLCLLPYHTIAADNKKHKIDEIIFVPAAKGILLPDGSIHDGTFIVRDTGGAFNGVGAQRVDMFVGIDPDTNNAFQRAGFDKTKQLKAFKVQGASADRVRENLKEKFGDLY